MARKSRRVKKGRQVRLSPTQMVQPGGRDAADVSPGFVQAYSEPKGVDLREEYRYVVADLRRIGVIAGAALAVLVVLALVLA